MQNRREKDKRNTTCLKVTTAKVKKAEKVMGATDASDRVGRDRKFEKRAPIVGD